MHAYIGQSQSRIVELVTEVLESVVVALCQDTAGAARETVQALKQQLAKKGAELERVKFQRDVQFEQETEMLSKNETYGE